VIFSVIVEYNSSLSLQYLSIQEFQVIITTFLYTILIHLGGIMVYGYIRVSTDKQTVENQRFEINNFCQKQNTQIDGWIEETISGTKNYTKRELGRLLEKVNKNDLIICAELSRLGRNLFMIMEILNVCMSKECKVWTIKDNYRLGDDIQSKVLAFAFGLSAEIERNLISQRTKEALARKKAEGVKLGRHKGERCHLNQKCKINHDRIISMLTNNVSKLQIARYVGVSVSTLYRYLVYTNLFDPINCKKNTWIKYGVFH
jgi:DNA invertase Pin-like site-specific DNA recombinase